MRKAITFLLFLTITVTQFTGAFTASAAWQPPAAPTCKAVYVVNANTNTVLYEKNAHERVYPASITKLMTAILTVEKFKNLDQKITVTHQDIDPLYGTSSSSAGLIPGEVLTVKQLLNCLLVHSANESANVLARAVAGNVDDFVAMMNQKAKELGALDTHYANPHGLHDPNHYSSAYDVYLIARYAVKDQTIKEIVAQRSYKLPATNKHGPRTLVNSNLVLNPGKPYYFRYVKGIKTGTTTPAGTCLVSYAENDGYTYFCVTMGGPKKPDNTNVAFADTKKLYQWAFKSFQLKTLVDIKEPQAPVKVDFAWNKDRIILYPDKAFTALVPKNADVKKVKLIARVPASVRAPVKQGQVIGTADVLLDGQKVGTVNLISNEAAEKSDTLYYLYLAGRFFSSVWFKIVSVCIILLFIAYLVFSFHYNRSKNMINKRRYKKFKMK